MTLVDSLSKHLGNMGFIQMSFNDKRTKRVYNYHRPFFCGTLAIK